MQTLIPKGNLRGFIMPDFIFKDARLCLGAKMLFAVMCNFAGDKDHCWPSHNTLAKSLNCSVSTIKTYLKQLAHMEQERSQEEKQKNTLLRPIYEAIASKFQQGVSGASFGLWAFLYSKGLAPSEKDIPQNAKDIHFLHWLHGYKQHNSKVL